MKPRSWIALALVLLLAAAGAAFVLLPKSLHLAVEATMQSNGATVGPYVSDLREWHGWTTWLDRDYDPTESVDYTGTLPGVGEAVSWKGSKVGSGKVDVVATDETGGMVYRGDVDGFSGSGHFAVDSLADGSVHVRWTFDGDAPGWNLYARARTRAVRRRFQGWMQESLAHLTDLSEHTLRPPGRLPRQTVVKFNPEDLK